MDPNSIIRSIKVGRTLENSNTSFPFIPGTTLGQFLAMMDKPDITMYFVDGCTLIWTERWEFAATILTQW